jgi:hypothetical protein
MREYGSHQSSFEVALVDTGSGRQRAQLAEWIAGCSPEKSEVVSAGASSLIERRLRQRPYAAQFAQEQADGDRPPPR